MDGTVAVNPTTGERVVLSGGKWVKEGAQPTQASGWPATARVLPNNKVFAPNGKGGVIALGNLRPDFTESASKAGDFASRMQGAEEDIARLSFSGKKTRTPGDVSVSGFLAGEEGTGGPLNFLRSGADQSLEAAQREWIAALLRKDTGAAVTPQEFKLYGPMYFPQPGDKPETIAQKQRARERAFRGSVSSSEGSFETNFGRPYYPTELSGRSPLRRPGGPQYNPKTQAPQSRNIARPRNEAEFNRIPVGTQYVNPADGRVLVKVR